MMEKDTKYNNPYQKAIFEFIKNGKGNLLVEAVAGSGKTTTIVNALNIIPEDKNVLFCAFNNDVAKILQERIGIRPNVYIGTIHHCGYVICKDCMDFDNDTPDNNKYMGEFIKNKNKYTFHGKHTLKGQWRNYYNNIRSLLTIARVNLVQTIDEVKEIANYYEIALIADEAKIVLDLINWGRENTNIIAFDDMICYPLELGLDFSGFSDFDFIFVDECQDLSKAQREFILKCGNKNTRYIFVGDSRQAIYGFNGADPRSFDELRKLPNITSLPLSVSYRCPKSIINNLVKPIVPQIEAKDDALEGSIRYEKTLDEVRDGDLILCRNNAPLTQVYNNLLRMNRKAYIAGKDTGEALIAMIQEYDDIELYPNLEQKGLFYSLYKNYFKLKEEIMIETGLDENLCDSLPQLSGLLDKIESLRILSEGHNTMAQLINRLSRVFLDEKEYHEGIKLSTVHKAKGTESENVYIIRNDLFAPEKKNAEWEKIQELNLEYVAYTRAKRNLSFIKNSEVVPSHPFTLKEIKDRLYLLDHPLKQYAGREIFSSSTISGRTSPGRTFIMDNTNKAPENTSKNLLNQFMQPKKRKNIKL